jgi:hypothetical protein
LRTFSFLSRRNECGAKQKENKMKKSVLDQFVSDAINAPETITGGRHGRKTRTRTRGASISPVAQRRTRNRTRTRH